MYSLTGQLREKGLKDLSKKCDVLEKDIPKHEGVTVSNDLYNGTYNKMDNDQLRESAERLERNLGADIDVISEAFNNCCCTYNGLKRTYYSIKKKGIDCVDEYGRLKKHIDKLKGYVILTYDLISPAFFRNFVLKNSKVCKSVYGVDIKDIFVSIYGQKKWDKEFNAKQGNMEIPTNYSS